MTNNSNILDLSKHLYKSSLHSKFELFHQKSERRSLVHVWSKWKRMKQKSGWGQTNSNVYLTWTLESNCCRRLSTWLPSLSTWHRDVIMILQHYQMTEIRCLLRPRGSIPASPNNTRGCDLEHLSAGLQLENHWLISPTPAPPKPCLYSPKSWFLEPNNRIEPLKRRSKGDQEQHFNVGCKKSHRTVLLRWIKVSSQRRERIRRNAANWQRIVTFNLSSSKRVQTGSEPLCGC